MGILIFGSNLSCLVKQNLTLDTLFIGVVGSLFIFIFILGKPSFFHSIIQITLILLMWESPTVKNTVISLDFLVWKFCRKQQFPDSFGRFARNYAKTVPFRKISTPENQVKLRYFSQCPFCGIRLYLSL